MVAESDQSTMQAESSEYDDDTLNKLFDNVLKGTDDDEAMPSSDAGDDDLEELFSGHKDEAHDDEAMSRKDADDDVPRTARPTISPCSSAASSPSAAPSIARVAPIVTATGLTLPGISGVSLPQGCGVSLPQGSGASHSQNAGALVLPTGSGDSSPQDNGNGGVVFPQSNNALSCQPPVSAQAQPISVLRADFAGLRTSESSAPTLQQLHAPVARISPTPSPSLSPSLSRTPPSPTLSTTSSNATSSSSSGSSPGPQKRARSSNSRKDGHSTSAAASSPTRAKAKLSGYAGRKKREAAIAAHAEWKRKRDAGEQVGEEPRLPKTRTRVRSDPEPTPRPKWTSREDSQESLLAGIQPRFANAQSSEQEQQGHMLQWSKIRDSVLRRG